MLKKSKLLLAIMPFMLASCGGNTECTISRSANTYTTSNESVTNYKFMCYTIGVVDGKSVTVTKDNFKAVENGKTYNPVCLLNSVSYGTSTGWIYDKTIDSKAIPSSSETSVATSVYVGFAAGSDISGSSQFYCKDNLITTSTIIIKL